MIFARYVLLTSCALGRAVHDSTEMLQALGVDHPPAKVPLQNVVLAKEFTWLKFMGTEKEKTGTWPSVPGMSNYTELQETIGTWKIGLNLVIDAMRQEVDAQMLMVKEVEAGLKAYHAVVGEENFCIHCATEEQFSAARLALLDVLGVFEHGWQRTADIRRKNFKRVHDFYSSGKGSQIQFMRSEKGQRGIAETMAPENVDMMMRKYFDPIETAKKALARETKTKMDRTMQFLDAFTAIMQLVTDVDRESQQIQNGQDSGEDKEEFKKIRAMTEDLVGKDVMDKCEESIDLRWEVAKKNRIHFTRALSPLLRP